MGVEIRFRNVLQAQIKRYSAVESNVERVQPFLAATKTPVRTRPGHIPPSRMDNPSRMGNSIVAGASEGMSPGHGPAAHKVATGQRAVITPGRPRLSLSLSHIDPD